jgi:hypothetical protein
MHVPQTELKVRSLVLGLGILGAAIVAGTGGYLIKSASVTPIFAAPASISAPAAFPASANTAPAIPTQTAMASQPASGGSVADVTNAVAVEPVLATDQPAPVVAAAQPVEVPAASEPADVAEPVTVAAAPADDQTEPADVPDGE